MKAARQGRLSAPQLGRALGMSSTWVYDVERGRIQPSPPQVAAIAELLEESADWLVMGRRAQESRFIGRLKALEPDLDARAERIILSIATREAHEARLARERAEPYDEEVFDYYVQALRDAGADEALLSQVVPAARQRLRARDTERPAAAAPRRPGRRQGRREG